MHTPLTKRGFVRPLSVETGLPVGDWAQLNQVDAEATVLRWDVGAAEPIRLRATALEYRVSGLMRGGQAVYYLEHAAALARTGDDTLEQSTPWFSVNGPNPTGIRLTGLDPERWGFDGYSNDLTFNQLRSTVRRASTHVGSRNQWWEVRQCGRITRI